MQELLEQFSDPEYRQLTIEALMVLSDYFKKDPYKPPEKDPYKPPELDLMKLIERAVDLHWEELYPEPQVADTNCKWNVFYESPSHVVAINIRQAIRGLFTHESARCYRLPITRTPVRACDIISLTRHSRNQKGTQSVRAYAPLFPAFLRVFHGN